MKNKDLFSPLLKGKEHGPALRNIGSQKELLKQILLFAIHMDLPEAINLSTYSRWFNGSFPKDVSERIVNEIDRAEFTDSFAGLLIDKELPTLCESFGIDCGEAAPDPYAFSYAFSCQLQEIAGHEDGAASIMNSMYGEYLREQRSPRYVTSLRKKFEKIKTIFFYAKEQSFQDFYVCNYLKPVSAAECCDEEDISDVLHPIELIEDVTPESLREYSQGCAIITGVGGIGKSMMMTHLLLLSLTSFEEGGALPVFVRLREQDFSKDEMLDVLYKETVRYDRNFKKSQLEQYLKDGKTIVLLDGMDEIRDTSLELFQQKLDRFIDSFPDNQYVVSSRKFSDFVNMRRFRVFEVENLVYHQAYQLSGKLIDMDRPDDINFKTAFLNELPHYYVSHREFATNPLLLTLMIFRHKRYQDIPVRKYQFYQQVYDTLLCFHDGDTFKKRRFRCVPDPDEFTELFSEFCGKSYHNNDYEFTDVRIETYFKHLDSLQNKDPQNLTVRNFIYDACYNASVMLEEGNNYSFLHRSFQEFLFVHYYVRREDAVYRKAAKFLIDESVTRKSYEIRDIFSMFVDADTKKFEKLVILPLLSSIFDGNNDELAYWNFLSALFSKWLFFLSTEKFRKFAEEYKGTFIMPDFIHINLPHGMLFAHILGKTSDSRISLPSFPDFEERPEFSELEAGNCTGYYLHGMGNRYTIQLAPLPVDTSDSILAGPYLIEENGENCFIGKLYKVKFQDIFDNREKYKVLYDYWNEDSQRELVHFIDVKNYYFGLKAQYSTDDGDSMSW